MDEITQIYCLPSAICEIILSMCLQCGRTELPGVILLGSSAPQLLQNFLAVTLSDLVVPRALVTLTGNQHEGHAQNTSLLLTVWEH